MFLYDSVSSICKKQNWTLKHNCSLFPSRFLTAKQWDTNGKDWHESNFSPELATVDKQRGIKQPSDCGIKQPSDCITNLQGNIFLRG